MLYQHRQVTKAANELHLTQSAVSNALNQLRDLLQDELFVRQPRSMEPTPFAHSIAKSVQQIIDTASHIFHHEDIFNPATSTRDFHIGMSDYVEFIVMPRLAPRLQEVAPHIRLTIKHQSDITSGDEFLSNRLDLAIGILKKGAKHIESHELFTAAPVCVADINHPFMQTPITPAQFLASRHYAVSLHQNSNINSTNVTKTLRKKGLTRDVAVTFPHILPMLYALPGTNYIATIPAWVKRQKQKLCPINKKLANKLGIVYQPFPFEVSDRGFYLSWHKGALRDAGINWLKGLIIDAMKLDS